MNERMEQLPMIPLRGLHVFPDMVLNFDLERPLSIAAMNAAMAGLLLRQAYSSTMNRKPCQP